MKTERPTAQWTKVSDSVWHSVNACEFKAALRHQNLLPGGEVVSCVADLPAGTPGLMYLVVFCEGVKMCMWGGGAEKLAGRGRGGDLA